MPDNIFVVSDSGLLTLFKVESDEKISFLETPENVRIIGKRAFAYFELSHIKLNEGLIEINEEAFSGSTADEIDLPESLSIIRDRAFESCRHLKKLYIPKNVHSIGRDILSYSGVEKIEISPENKYYTMKDSIIYTHDMQTVVLNAEPGNNYIVLADTVKEIYQNVFAMNTHIEKIELNEQNIKSCKNVFYGMVKLETVILKNNIGEAYEIDVSDMNKWNSEITIFNEFIVAEESGKEELFKKIKKIKVKIMLAYYMVKTYNIEFYESYLKKTGKRAINYFISKDCRDGLEYMLELNNPKDVDEFIEFANENENTECQMILMNYKNEKIGFENNLSL